MLDLPLSSDTAAFFSLHVPSKESASFLSQNEGALSVDVHEYPDMLIIRAPIAGVRPGDLDLALHNDMLTIRGKRTALPLETDGVLLHQECHWGPFSRSIILPTAVRADEAEAKLIDGVLTIRLPKIIRHGSIPITRL